MAQRGLGVHGPGSDDLHAMAALIDPHCAPAAPCCPVVLASTEIPESSQEVEPRPQERSATRPWTPDGTGRAVSSCRAPGPARPPCPSAPSAHAWPSREVAPHPHSGTVRSPGVPARLTGTSARHLGLQGWRGDWHSEEQWLVRVYFLSGGNSSLRGRVCHRALSSLF